MKKHFANIQSTFICLRNWGKFLYILLFFQVLSHAQPATDSITNESDFIEYYKDDIMLRVGVSNSFNALVINDVINDLNFTLKPNQQIRTTATLLFRFIEVDVGYTPDFLKFNKDDDKNGKTSYFNIGTRLYYKKWMQNLQWYKTRGYYIDAKEVNGLEQNLIFSDFKVTKVGGSTSFVCNPNFSFRAIFKQSEWQKKSAGSFVPTLTYYYTEISNENPGKNEIFDIVAGPAYFYNWVLHDHFLISGGIYTGIGYNNSKFVGGDTPNSSIDGINYMTEVRFAVAYNSRNYFLGANVNFNSFYNKLESNVKVSEQQQFLEFYFGYRFKAPEKLLRKIDQATLLDKK